MRQRCLVLVAAAGLLHTSFAYSQRTETQQVYKILGISVEGAAFADPGAIIANSGLKVGDEISVPGEHLGDAIRKLWSLAIFSDVQIGIDRVVEDGVFLLIRVTELPRFDRVDITGNDEIDIEDIEKKV